MICTPNTEHSVLGVHIRSALALFGLKDFHIQYVFLMNLPYLLKEMEISDHFKERIGTVVA